MSGDDHGTTNECGAIPPNVRGPVPCHLEPGHDGQHFSTSGCAGSEIHWRGVRAINAVNVCPRRQCRGRTRHSRLVHWLGWVRR